MRECVTHHHACDCREEKFKETENQLKEALSIIEELKASNEFYADPRNENWVTLKGLRGEKCVRIRSEDVEPMPEIYTGKYLGGKLARRTKQSTDQRIEKLKKEVPQCL